MLSNMDPGMKKSQKIQATIRNTFYFDSNRRVAWPDHAGSGLKQTKYKLQPIRWLFIFIPFNRVVSYYIICLFLEFIKLQQIELCQKY